MSAKTSPAASGDAAGGSRAEAGNVADLVRSAAQRGAQHPALVDGPTAQQLTWSELDAAVDAEAHRLVDAGVGPGDRVAVHLPTGAAFCVALFGALRAGGAAVPLPTSSPPAELERIIADSGSRVLVADGGVPVSADVSVLPAPELTPSAKPDPVLPRTGGSELAILSYTSGTSGPPRAAMLPHGALLANVRQCARLRPMPVNAADRVLLALPLFHVYGLGPGLLQVAAVGATAVLLPRFDPEEALDAIARLRVTTVVGVPPMYSAWLRLPPARLREGMATVRLLTSGAAPLGGEVSAAVRAATGLDVFEGYGLTETGPVLTTTLAGGVAKPGSVGRPLPGVELRLVDSDGTPLADEDEGDTGRVAVRGPNLFSGYWPDGDHGPDADGWFRTGDVGYLDADGDLHLVDRATDLIIVNGFNVYPHEVERALLELDGVAEAAVVGIPDETTGEAVKAVLVAEPGTGPTADAVRAHCAGRLARFKIPTVVEFADSLPHSPTGKLARRSLRS
ncbi:AMP-binding protein [Saccharopolyspora taberi]|uniref:Long-chain fatty acid--CoA ligase n=1 Tax=Saccharopolyspora taberi TaxID=60895 RepID=A0ABN3VNC0_9PSEU